MSLKSIQSGTNPRGLHTPLEKTRDSTLAELRAALAEQGISLGQTTLWRFFARHRITLKRKTAPAAEQDQADVLRRR